MTAFADLLADATPVPAHRPWPRALVTTERLASRDRHRSPRADARCSASGREPATVHMALRRREGARRRRQPRLPGRPLPLGRRPPCPGDPPRARHPRPLSASVAEGAVDTRPWLDHGRWGVTHPLAAADADAGRRPAAALPLPPGRGRRPASDPGRSGPCRHHRARPFPLHRQRRDRGAPRGAARLRPQGHRRPDARAPISPPRRSSPAAPPATRPSPTPMPSPAPSRRRPGPRRRPAPSGSAR